MVKLELLKKLTKADGISGNESAVRDIILDTIKDVVDEWRVDAMGSLIAVKKARIASNSEDIPSLLIAAHMDEVGLMITGIEDKGLLKFKPVGGLDPRVLVGKRLRIGKDAVSGVIGYAPIHLQEVADRTQAPRMKSLRIDIGAKTKEEAEGAVEIGDTAAFDAEPVLYGQNKLMAKALDDRAGCAVLAALLQEEWPIDIVAAFNVQEEIGLKGSKTSTFAIKPTHAVILEGTTCYDVPDTKEHMMSSFSGKGPVVTIMDRSVINNPAFVRFAVETAEQNHIPWQPKNTISGGTDAGRIQANATGVKVLTMAVPCRYIHTPVSVMDINDFEHMFQLSAAIINRFPEFLQAVDPTDDVLEDLS